MLAYNIKGEKGFYEILFIRCVVLARMMNMWSKLRYERKTMILIALRTEDNDAIVWYVGKIALRTECNDEIALRTEDNDFIDETFLIWPWRVK